MTKSRVYTLTGISAALYVFLCWAFADGLFTSGLWKRDEIAGSSIFAWLFLAAIIGAGLWQARNLPAHVDTTARPSVAGQVDDPKFWHLLMGNVYFAILWMPLRFFVGQEWVAAGEHKLRDSAWVSGGTALQGFWERAVAVPETGRPAITYSWYRDFLQYMLDNEWYSWFGKLIAVGEFMIGLGLIVGALVGIAAFFGTLLNFSFLMAGTTSTNPVLFGIGIFLVLGWKVAGHWGLDRYLLPLLGTPWHTDAPVEPVKKDMGTVRPALR